MAWTPQKPLLVGCVPDEELLRACARRRPADCDWIEFRQDLAGDCNGDWVALCARLRDQGCPVLLTVRDASEGGRWSGGGADRLELYREGLSVAAAVDMEIASAELPPLMEIAHERGVAVVGSCHFFDGTPPLETLRETERRGRALGVDVVKIAARAETPEELARLLALPALADGPVAVVGMGRYGTLTRVVLPAAGSCLVYGALGEATAPGQPTCAELARELERWGIRDG